MEDALTLLASSALDTSKRSERLRLLEQAIDLCKDDHGEALAKATGTKFHPRLIDNFMSARTH